MAQRPVLARPSSASRRRRTSAARTNQALQNCSSASNGSMAGTPNDRRDALGHERAHQAAQRAGAGNLAEALLRRARVEPLAGDQPEPGRQNRPAPLKYAGRRRRRSPSGAWDRSTTREGTARRWRRTSRDQRAGPALPRGPRMATTSTIEQTEVASSIAGSAVKSSEVRNSASRMALPVTNCAVTAAALSIAATTDRDLALRCPCSAHLLPGP